MNHEFKHIQPIASSDHRDEYRYAEVFVTGNGTFIIHAYGYDDTLWVYGAVGNGDEDQLLLDFRSFLNTLPAGQRPLNELEHNS